MKKIIKDPCDLVRVLNTLQPMSARLLLHFILTKPYNSPFNCTLYEMGVEGQVKNPQRALAEILSKGYITRERLKNSRLTYSYTLQVDLIDHS